jgi:hypothetical protein
MTAKSGGRPSLWLRHYRRGHAEGGVEVPCGDCTACCRGPRVIIDEASKDHYRCEPLPSASPGKKGVWALKQRDDGRCTYLGPSGRCEIYDRRPPPCRLYDCRLLLHCGILPPNGPLRDAVLSWTPPAYADAGDYEVALALRTEAARLLKEGACATADEAAETAVLRSASVLERVRADLAALQPSRRRQACAWVLRGDQALAAARRRAEPAAGDGPGQPRPAGRPKPEP